jgi:importin subunit beta-1
MIINVLLENSISPDNRIRSEAERTLEQLFNDDYCRFILELFEYYSSEKFDDSSRKLAGLTIKNSFVSRERKGPLQITRLNKWHQQSVEFKLNIKERAMGILKSQNLSLSTTSCQIISSLAFLEFNKSPWNDLLMFLFEGSGSENIFLKVNSVETLGFLAEILDPHHLVPFSNQILTIIVGNMKIPDSEYATSEFRLSIISCKAFINSFTFIDSNFKNAYERNYIMTTILTLASSFIMMKSEHSIELSHTAWESLVKTVQYYYPYVASYFLDNNVTNLILKGISCDLEPITLQAMELLSSIGEIESDLILCPRDILNENIIRSKFNELIYHLLERLIHPQDKSDIESDEWSTQMAASICLSHLIPCIGAEVSQCSLLTDFIKSGLSSHLWNRREASIMVLGSLLEIEDKKSLNGLVLSYLPKLTRTLSNDDSYLVRDSASWVLGKMFDFYHNLIPTEDLSQLIDLLLHNIMHSNGELATNCCWALMNLVIQYGDETTEDEESSYNNFDPITDSYLKNILSSLISSLKRKDIFSSNLLSALFQTLYNIICCTVKRNIDLIKDFLIFVLGQLDTCSFITNNEDKIHNSQLINGFYLLCQGCFKKLGFKKCYEVIDFFNSINIKLYNEYGNYIVEEMFPAILTWFLKLQKSDINCLSGLISQYFPLVERILLSSTDDFSTSLLALNFLNDLIQNFSEELQFCGIDTLLLAKAIALPTDSDQIKIKLVSCIGDLALFLKPVFENNQENLVKMVLHILNYISENILLINTSDNFGDQIGDIFQALSCIFRSIEKDKKKILFLEFTPEVFNFLENLSTSVPELFIDLLFDQLIGITYDLVQIFGNDLKPFKNQRLLEFINEDRDLSEEIERMKYSINLQMSTRYK